MDLSEIRKEIDLIDQQLVALFCIRMGLSAQVSDYKKANGLPIHVPSREQEILHKITELAGEEFAPSVQTLYSAIFQISRDYQAQRNSEMG